jgi:hypothetical protein
MTTTFKILGINDEVTTCECCGKTNLKKTVVLSMNGEGEVHYGVNCAASALRGSKKSGDRKAVETEAAAVSLARKWLNAGHTPEVVAKGIWNRFGFRTGVKDGEVLIDNFGRVKAG